MSKLLPRILGAAVLFTATIGANAAMIDGFLGVAGGGSLATTGGVTTITFGSGTLVNSGGDLSSVNNTNINFIPSLTIDPFTGPVNVWSSTTNPSFAFELQDVISSSINPAGLSTFIGTGLLTAVSFDPTPSLFKLTFNTFNGEIGFFTTSNTAVPIPAAGWLFGSALIGIASVARRGRKSRLSETQAS
ncbi:VPLPA-CTERM sorting domain-containing protein [Thiocystis violacea]|uniref:VPLPA-CTERM sorting domain-containing protein n=1 Tax=Thiocystis violacea TaxID=13725 RepID=UPI001906D8C4|nr:VPLPA-CTERM sorting domain-containing protein [Thiocystis violacea]MBK1721199.1 hypothetical protein [Thiocystis violacea]